MQSNVFVVTAAINKRTTLTCGNILYITDRQEFTSKICKPNKKKQVGFNIVNLLYILLFFWRNKAEEMTKQTPKQLTIIICVKNYLCIDSTKIKIET